MHLPRKLVGLLLAAGTVVGVTAAAAPAMADTGTPYVYFATVTQPAAVFVPTGLCLEADPGPDFAYRVATQPCDQAHNRAQQWLPIAQGGGVYKFANVAVGWCLYTDTRSNGSPIALWDCSANISNTRWTWDGILGFEPLESRISGTTGHCLDIPMGQVLANLWTQLWTCNHTPAQIFLKGQVILP
jgi:hypothetical protein